MAKAKTKDKSCGQPERAASVAVDLTAHDGEEASVGVPKTIITPVSKRIGESRNNLQRREDWYQRRTGSGT